MKLGIWIRTLIESRDNLAMALAERFIKHERHRITRQKSNSVKSVVKSTCRLILLIVDQWYLLQFGSLARCMRLSQRPARRWIIMHLIPPSASTRIRWWDAHQNNQLASNIRVRDRLIIR
jgi:hypothetical protein